MISSCRAVDEGSGSAFIDLLPDLEIKPSVASPIVLELTKSINLTCHFMAPSTFFVFYQDDLVVQNSTDEVLIIKYDNSSSVLQGGEYRCEVDGILMSINFVQVQFAPNITQHPSSVYVTIDSDVKFICTAVGFPIPNIKWIELPAGVPLDNFDYVAHFNEDDSGGLMYNDAITNNDSSIESMLIFNETVYSLSINSYICAAWTNGIYQISTNAKITGEKIYFVYFSLNRNFHQLYWDTVDSLFSSLLW